MPNLIYSQSCTLTPTLVVLQKKNEFILPISVHPTNESDKRDSQYPTEE